MSNQRALLLCLHLTYSISLDILFVSVDSYFVCHQQMLNGLVLM